MENFVVFLNKLYCTHDGIIGGGRPGLARVGGGPPGPGLLGIAGAGRPLAGTGGGARELEIGGGCVTPRLGPPGDGGDNLKRICSIGLFDFCIISARFFRR